MKEKLNLLLVLLMIFTLASCGQKTSENTETEDESVAAEVVNEEPEEQQQVASPRQQATGTVDGVTVNVDYGSPAVKDREVWGSLEKYGVVWRAGANETTSMEFDNDVTINGEKLPAGKYGFFIIPNENEPWVAIFNEEWSREEHDSWGAYNYKEDKDVLRINIEPTWAEDVQERLEYTVSNTGVDFAWEKARVSLEVKSDN